MSSYTPLRLISGKIVGYVSFVVVVRYWVWIRLQSLW